MSSSTIPSALLCPITCVPFVDPVLAEDGVTYERSAIQRWFASGKTTSPMTRSVMSTKLIPNRAVKDEVERLQACAAPAPAAAPEKGDAGVTVTATYDPERRLLHARFLADAPTSEGTDIVLMLDNSGSMGHAIASPLAAADKEVQKVTRLDIAVHATRVLAALCSDRDRFSLFTFSSVAKMRMPLTHMNSTGKERLDTVLQDVLPEDSTNLWDALRVATAMVDDTPRGRRVAVILLTDGEPTSGTPPRGLVESLPILTPRGPFTFHVLGLSDAVDSLLLGRIARWGLGTFGFIPSGDMVGTVCINTAAHCLSVSHRGTWFDTPNGHPGFMTGPLLHGQPRDFIFPCDSPPKEFCVAKTLTIPVTTAPLDAFEAARFALLETLDAVLQCRMNRGGPELAPACERLLRDFVGRFGNSTDERVRLLVRDVSSPSPNEGQVLLACRYLDTWGWHYLRCYRSAQDKQHCVNFKDVGLQGYGGPLFQRLVVAGDKTFALMPPMKLITPVTRAYTGFYGGGGGGAAAATAAVAPPAAPVDYSVFHNSSGSCFAGECRVRMARDDAMLPIADLRRGDTVWTPDGPATVLYAVQMGTKARSLPMTQIGRLCITPWHPIRDAKGAWGFPAHSHGYSSRLVSTVYNLVLTKGHVVDVEGTLCVTLAHGFTEDPVAHAFFGTHAVIATMEGRPGFTEGRPVFKNLVAAKNADGLICGWREGE